MSEVVHEKPGMNVARCYQCGKCSAGCPMAAEMDLAPSFMTRLMQTGAAEAEDRLLRSRAIWLCLGCETCLSRCPMEIDIPRLIDGLRAKSFRQKKAHPDARRILAFHQSFLATIRATGRLYEVGLIMDYKRRTLALTQDLAVAPAMLQRGKLRLLPERIRDHRGLARIFRKAMEAG